MPPTAIPILALATTTVGTGYSIYQGQQANKFAAKSAAQAQIANDAQRRQQELQAARQRRDAVREARIASATATQTAVNQGVSASSAALGGQASIMSQLGDTMSFLDRYNFLSDTASAALGKAAVFESKSRQASNNAQTGAQIADAGMSVFNNASSIQKVFKRG